MFRLASFALFLCASAQDDTKPHALLGSVPLMDMTMAELHQIKLIRDDGPNFFADVNAIEQGPCNVDESCKAKNAGPCEDIEGMKTCYAKLFGWFRALQSLRIAYDRT
eukprot:GHVP01053930.1.p1 GENE.GHVP01053930.1~~GHVP01053930.1.p1  ORF type:complete len:108 (+),score=15.82 GHVP01053930.1:313-636(+)